LPAMRKTAKTGEWANLVSRNGGKKSGEVENNVSEDPNAVGEEERPESS